MTSILGNTQVNLQITGVDMNLNLDSNPAITLTYGSTDIDFNNYKIINVADATNNVDVLTKGRAD